MKSTRLLSLCMMSFLLCSCVVIAKDAKGKEVTKQIPAKEFSAIDLKGIADIVYTQEKTPSISVTAPEDLMELIDVAVRNNTLIVSTEKMENARRWNNVEVVVHASSQLLNNIDSRGTGDILLNGVINLNRFSVVVQGTGDLKAENLHCQSLDLNCKGTGDVNLGGTAQKADFTVKGTGDVQAFNFKVNSLIVDVKGTGDMRCNASEISIDYSGTGSLYYKGNPVIKKINSQGVGSIKSVE